MSETLAHRLTKVLRLPDGAPIALFNGRDGLFDAVLANGRQRMVQVQACVQAQPVPACRLLAIGIPKKDTFAEVLRQATEMGVSDIYPLLTRYAVPDRLNVDKAQQKLIEAAEQCERLTIPVLHPLQSLTDWLKRNDASILWAYERLEHASTLTSAAPQGVLVGPEGGFSPDEVALLRGSSHMQPTRVATHILRVDTAVVAALSRLPE